MNNILSKQAYGGRHVVITNTVLSTGHNGEVGAAQCVAMSDGIPLFQPWNVVGIAFPMDFVPFEQFMVAINAETPNPGLWTWVPKPASNAEKKSKNNVNENEE